MTPVSDPVATGGHEEYTIFADPGAPQPDEDICSGYFGRTPVNRSLIPSVIPIAIAPGPQVPAGISPPQDQHQVNETHRLPQPPQRVVMSRRPRGGRGKRGARGDAAPEPPEGGH